MRGTLCYKIILIALLFASVDALFFINDDDNTQFATDHVVFLPQSDI